MEAQAFTQYFKAIKPINAEETLGAITVSMFPHMKKDRRTHVHRSLVKVIKESIKKKVTLLPYHQVRDNLLRKLRGG